MVQQSCDRQGGGTGWVLREGSKRVIGEISRWDYFFLLLLLCLLISINIIILILLLLTIYFFRARENIISKSGAAIATMAVLIEE